MLGGVVLYLLPLTLIVWYHLTCEIDSTETLLHRITLYFHFFILFSRKLLSTNCYEIPLYGLHKIT